MVFSAIRSALGYKNNPTAKKFSAAYKRLLIRHEIKGVGGNCMPLDSTSILCVTRDVITDKSLLHNDVLDVSVARRYDLVLKQENDEVSRLLLQQKHAKKCEDLSSLSEFKMFVITYVAGYVVKMVRRIWPCPTGSATKCVHAALTKFSGKLSLPA